MVHGQPSGTMKTQVLLSFFSARVLHRGPRLLLQLIVGSTLVFATLLVIRRAFDENLSSNDLFRYESEDIKDEKVHYEFQSQQHAGGLRVIVFGEDDVATPAWTRGEKEMRSSGWTEVMCQELNCSHYLSFIPPNLHPPAHTLISNDIYVEAVRQTIKNTITLKKTQGPGYDYTFQPRLFPVSKALPDLSAQVTAFLNLQNTTTLPKVNETLWVFNLGQWDVWSLATLPIATGKAVIDQLTDHVIEQMERLYQSTILNDITVASNNTELLPRKIKPGPMRIIDPEVYKAKSAAAGGGPVSGSAKEKTTKPEPETFRVFFPALFDISMTPGWNSNRPETPAPHSKAEQMRNAAKLTDMWNQVMGNKLYAWAERSDDIGLEELYLTTDTDVDNTSLDGGSANGDGKRNPAGQRKKTKAAAGKVVEPKPTPTGHKQPPVRDFITYDMVGYLTSALIEGQLHSSGLSDGNGLGQKPMNKWYKEVWEPCIKPVKSETEQLVDLEEEGLVQQSNSTTDSSKEKATTAFATGVQAEAAWAGGRKKERNTEAATSTEQEDGTSTVCNMPDDYLFYTPFTLGERAIGEIAREAAEKVRRGESFRAEGEDEEGLWAGVQGHNTG
ncbi:hypothetical protein N0V85_003435 [Neurospora sp. IMI 360204]|nr:hypothetical protein N0V85_003435 [Neurospora sp. IMI 360204]